MGANNIARLLTDSSAAVMLDPGDGGSIVVGDTLKTTQIVGLSTDTLYTRTLAVPPEVGIFHTLVFQTDNGNDITITVTGGYDQAGGTTLTLADVGDYALLQSINDSGTVRWQLIHYVSASEVVSTESVTLADSAYVEFGTGSDIRVTWDGTNLTSGPASGLWTGAPSVIDPDPSRAFRFFHDFEVAPTDANLFWVEMDDGTTGTNAVQDVAYGVGNIVTAAVDNDYHGIRTVAKVVDLLAAKELWFEARFKVAEATTNESAWWFGICDLTTTGGLQANALGPLDSYDGVLVWKDEGTMAIDVETSNAAVQDPELAIATFVTDTWTRVGFHVSGAATTAVVTAYYNVAGTGDLTAHATTMNLTRAGLLPMYIMCGIKAGPTAAAETLQVDYIKCVQMR